MEPYEQDSLQGVRQVKQIERSLRNDRKFPTTENYNCMTFDLKDAEEKNINANTMTKNCVWNCLEKPIRELHEEIMWIAEAAHVPVIWATQVLEHLAKKGQPSRAEITDAAMAERAECVMLNKGHYIWLTHCEC